MITCCQSMEIIVYSCAIWIQTASCIETVYKTVEKKFDTSMYSKEGTRPLPNAKNERAIGTMKDKLAGNVMTEFVAFSAKLYAYKKLDMKKPEDKKCKGIKKCVVKKTLMLEDYKKYLENGKNVYRNQTLCQNKDHEI